LQSAIANAQNLSEDVDVDKLVVSEAYVNDGPRMKRIRPAPMGRAYHYVRRISHIEIELAERGNSGDAVANVVGAERVSGTSTGASKPRTKAKGKAPARKSKAKVAKKFAGAR